jgi:hypothetical protein
MGCVSSSAAAQEPRAQVRKAISLDGDWTIHWESGETAAVTVASGRFFVFGHPYELSNTAPPTFTWPDGTVQTAIEVEAERITWTTTLDAERIIWKKAQSSAAPTLLTGQHAIIRNCPVARLNGERVVCEEYNAGLDEWMVKGDKFPLTVGMSLKEQFLEGVVESNN